jgi:hypothetical protein
MYREKLEVADVFRAHGPACEHNQIAYNSCRNRHCPIRHYGLTANTGCKKNLGKARQLLNVKVPIVSLDKERSGEVKSHELKPTFVCPCCGSGMIVKDVLLHLYLPRAPPPLLLS